MADTTSQVIIAKWITQNYLPQLFKTTFARAEVPLLPGGVHSFAAVSAGGEAVGSIVTGTARTAGGKLGVGKLNKVRADLYFLVLAECQKRFLAVVDKEMHGVLLDEQQRHKRIPAFIQIVHVELPEELAETLRAAQDTASREVSPEGRAKLI